MYSELPTLPCPGPETQNTRMSKLAKHPFVEKLRSGLFVGLLALLVTGCLDLDLRGYTKTEYALGGCRWERVIDNKTYNERTYKTYGGPECSSTPPSDKNVTKVGEARVR